MVGDGALTMIMLVLAGDGWLAGEASNCDVWGLRVNNTVMNTMFTL